MDVERGLQAITARLGPFHIAMCALLSTAYVYQALFNLTFVFTTMRSEHRCLVPECESNASLPDMFPPWLSSAVRPASADTCSPYLMEVECGGRGRRNVSVPCDQWVYPDKDLSIMTEWDLTCSNDWLIAMVGTANSLGRALGLPLFGYLSDAMGRRTALLVGLAVSCCLGTARSFAPNYATFVSLEFVDPLFYDGIGGAAFIMGMELMPVKARGAWSAITHVIFAVGLALLGVLAWLLPHWRLLLRVVYGSALLCLAALWFSPESVRWLASKGRSVEAFKIINKAAKMNGMPDIGPAAKSGTESQGPKVSDAAAPTPRSSFSMDIKEFCRSRILVLRLIVSCISWIAIMFVYDGLAVYSVSLAGDQYLNFVLMELVEVPAALIAWKTMASAGRRATLVGAILPAAACCVAYHFLPAPPHGAVWPRTAAVLLAKLCVTVAYTSNYVLAAELFPTRVRHTMYALSATCGRLGSALGPQMPLLRVYMESLPLLVFGAVSFLTGLLALTFPETCDEPLPDTVEQAEAIGKKRPGPGPGPEPEPASAAEAPVQLRQITPRCASSNS
ncbi:Solute carrier family 22 member 21 [Frankliniella fusca]|uniref:Solute carrier family 22 member 21 n=1 Tax=Frankliniella fusca TaxID=407009 RepID=A0AAE1HH24_9NEOP|nr:Solute carrier family 22 member 21 [Frankliniella fusca]